ncbi:hypothetical protein BCR39DRAFT_467925 [Naematelia encephala]|uniref:chitin deacetylase n=1 Tax=Naematelia encephala TaxID=71784 RepID=A0A1Y2B1S2_9TREE|nr:hypothetical protein BCR39DRAFT_467925 [Naematelia encephala]
MSFARSLIIFSILAGALAQDSSVNPATVTQAVASTTAAAASISIDTSLPQTPLVSAVDGYTIPALSELTSGAPTAADATLASTPTAGATVTYVSGAPPIPTAALVIANYPALDQVPPTNSSEVQAWISAIDWTKVPSYNATDGTCSGTPGAITDGRCWWTCGQCTRDTDITVCPDQYTWGTSFDDGPSPYTPALLDYLNEQSIKTTWFVVGSRVLSRPEMVQAEYASGHQLSVHTWSHPALTTLSNEEIVAELGWTKKVIYDTIGVTPNTMRPPYGDIDDRVRAICAQMGLTPILWTGIEVNNTDTNFDTTDWNIPGGKATGESALGKFEEILNTYVPMLDTGFIVLAHDLYQQTVDLAVGYVLPMAIQSGKFKLTSIIDCLGRPLSEAYIETSSNATQTLITSASTTYFQASVGGAGTAAVLPTSATSSGAASGSAGTSASGSSASGAGVSVSASRSAASSAASTGAASRGAAVSLGTGVGLMALAAVAFGTTLIA